MYIRHSSVRSQFEKQQLEWGNIHKMEVPLHFDSHQSELSSMLDLAICDVSPLPKLGIKGKGAPPAPAPPATRRRCHHPTRDR